jgi:glycosyltransferase involved in cell wall biosynthesis
MANKVRDWLPGINVVVSQNFITTAARQKPLPEIPTFLWMGRMMPEKRVLDFCKALDLVHDYTDKSFRAIIIGNGYHFENVKSWAEGRSDVTLAGSVANTAVHDYIDHSSALVMTSHGFDNQPMVIAESIVGGRGVVSIDPELLLDIDPKAGVYPPDSSPEGLAQELADLIESPAKLQSMSDAAAGCASIFNTDEGQKRLVGVYHMAIKNE